MRASCLLLVLSALTVLGCGRSSTGFTSQRASVDAACEQALPEEGKNFYIDIEAMDLSLPLDADVSAQVLSALSETLGCAANSPFFAMEKTIECAHAPSLAFFEVCTARTSEGVFILSEDFSQPTTVTVSFRRERTPSNVDCDEVMLEHFGVASKTFVVRSPTPNGLAFDTVKTMSKAVKTLADQYRCPPNHPIRQLDKASCSVIGGEHVCGADTAAGFLLMTDGPMGTLNVTFGVFD